MPATLRLLLAAMSLAAAARPAPAAESKLFAIDARAFPLRQHLTLYLTHPKVRAEPVLGPSSSPDAPDNLGAYFAGTVLHEGTRFRMWYCGMHATNAAGGVGMTPACYAESTDGLHWVRPDLGQVTWRGSRHNNLIALGDMNAPNENGFIVESRKTRGITGVCLIRDDEDPDPARRYKMIFEQRGVGVATSPDGFHWKENAERIPGGEPSGLWRLGRLYLVSVHLAGFGESGRPEGRQAYLWVSPDFEHWMPGNVPAFKVPEPEVGSGWGTDEKGLWMKPNGLGLYTQDHLGIAAIHAGRIMIGLYGMWNQHVPLWGEGGLDCDLGLVLSHDGLFFEEVVKGRPYIRSADSPAPPVPGKYIPTILIQSNGILDVGDETWIYHSRWRNSGYDLVADPTGWIAPDTWRCIALARLPRDRWGALGLWQGQTEGSVWTDVLKLGANPALRLNAAGLAGLEVEVGDENFQTFPEFSPGRTEAAVADSLDAAVHWRGHSLKELAGRTVRFHFHFLRSGGADPRLFALILGH